MPAPVRPRLFGTAVCPATASPRGSGCDRRVERAIGEVLAGLDVEEFRWERRRHARHPYPRLVRLVPLADDGRTAAGPAIVVAGRHLSVQGFDFFHFQPLPYRFMCLELERPPLPPIWVVLDVSWCRFTQGRWYESGGRFRHLAGPPAGVK